MTKCDRCTQRRDRDNSISPVVTDCDTVEIDHGNGQVQSAIEAPELSIDSLTFGFGMILENPGRMLVLMWDHMSRLIIHE